jgi:hypothetical protein
MEAPRLPVDDRGDRSGAAEAREPAPRPALLRVRGEAGEAAPNGAGEVGDRAEPGGFSVIVSASSQRARRIVVDVVRI